MEFLGRFTLIEIGGVTAEGLFLSDSHHFMEGTFPIINITNSRTVGVGQVFKLKNRFIVDVYNNKSISIKQLMEAGMKKFIPSGTAKILENRNKASNFQLQRIFLDHGTNFEHKKQQISFKFNLHRYNEIPIKFK